MSLPRLSSPAALRAAVREEAARRLAAAFPTTSFQLSQASSYDYGEDTLDFLALECSWIDGPAARAVEALLAPLTPVLSVPGLGELSGLPGITSSRWISISTRLALLLSFEEHTPGSLAPLHAAAEALVTSLEHHATLATQREATSDPHLHARLTRELHSAFYGDDAYPGVMDLVDEFRREQAVTARRAEENLLGADILEVSLPHPALASAAELAQLALGFERPSALAAGDFETSDLSWALARALPAARACLVGA